MKAVSLHPYFKVNPGQLEAVKTLLGEFVDRTSAEEKALYYEFTLNGDEVFCREAYTDADGVLTHLKNVGPQLDQMLTLSTLARLEVHGPEEELAKLRGPLASMPAAWFVYQCGIAR